MSHNEGVSIKLVMLLIEEFSTVDSLYQESRLSLPVTATSEVYDAIANSVCEDALYNVQERLPDSLGEILLEMNQRNPKDLQTFVRELYDTWSEKGKPGRGDYLGIMNNL